MLVIGLSVMVNIIGCSSFLCDLLSIDGSYFYWYGKFVCEKCKMGYINVIMNSYESLGEKFMVLSKYLLFEYFLKLVGEVM